MNAFQNSKNMFGTIGKTAITNQIEEAISFAGDWFVVAVQSQIEKFAAIEKDTEEQIKLLNDQLSGQKDARGIPCASDMELYDLMSGLNYELYATNEQHYSIWEMIFINLFKTIEISIKTQISIAYPDVNLKDFFNWEVVREFFKTKGIDICTFSEYQIINEIRFVNNNLKHSPEIVDNVFKQKIPEFNGLQNFTSTSLQAYYLRIKSIPKIFLERLGKAIIEELFTYSDERLEQLSIGFKSKMDKETIGRLIAKLKSG